MNLEEFIDKFGTKYSELLGINLKKEPFKWFLASILFGARITEKIAINTYYEFEKEELDNPAKIVKRGWDGLVEILDTGGYVRYDFKTADKLLEVCKNLIEKYNSDLNKLHQSSANSKDLEKKIKDLGKGIGDLTANIFLREIRNVWRKANPKPAPLVLLAMKKLGLKDIRDAWKIKFSKFDFCSFEVALLRLGKNYCRKNKCNICLVKEECKTGKKS